MQSWLSIAPSPAAQLLSRKKSLSQLLDAVLSPGSCSPGGSCPSCLFTGPAPRLDCRSHCAPGHPANKMWRHDDGAGWEPGTVGQGLAGQGRAWEGRAEHGKAGLGDQEAALVLQGQSLGEGGHLQVCVKT